MWVFDGEEWIREDGSFEAARDRKPEPVRPRFDQNTPELQVIEVVPLPRRERVPPYPLPTP